MDERSRLKWVFIIYAAVIAWLYLYLLFEFLGSARSKADLSSSVFAAYAVSAISVVSTVSALLAAWLGGRIASRKGDTHHGLIACLLTWALYPFMFWPMILLQRQLASLPVAVSPVSSLPPVNPTSIDFVEGFLKTALVLWFTYMLTLIIAAPAVIVGGLSFNGVLRLIRRWRGSPQPINGKNL